MKVILAARFSAFAFLLAALFTAFVTRSGFRIVGVLLPRQAWLLDHSALWALGWWFWLTAIFSWMTVLVALLWSYLPGHRIGSMLQSGLMILAALFLTTAALLWMNLLPFAAAHAMATDFVPLIDMLALTALGAGFLMMGGVTGWICVDLWRGKLLPLWLVSPGLLCALALLPMPFYLPGTVLPALGILLWVVWCLLLGLRRSLPSAYSEWV